MTTETIINFFRIKLKRIGITQHYCKGIDMGLRTRIERLEAATKKSGDAPPEIVIQFEGPNGECEGGLRLIPVGGKQWLDADMKPIGPPIWEEGG
jgi:hypothetical protein